MSSETHSTNATGNITLEQWREIVGKIYASAKVTKPIVAASSVTPDPTRAERLNYSPLLPIVKRDKVIRYDYSKRTELKREHKRQEKLAQIVDDQDLRYRHSTSFVLGGLGSVVPGNKNKLRTETSNVYNAHSQCSNHEIPVTFMGRAEMRRHLKDFDCDESDVTLITFYARCIKHVLKFETKADMYAHMSETAEAAEQVNAEALARFEDSNAALRTAIARHPKASARLGLALPTFTPSEVGCQIGETILLSDDDASDQYWEQIPAVVGAVSRVLLRGHPRRTRETQRVKVNGVDCLEAVKIYIPVPDWVRRFRAEIIADTTRRLLEQDIDPTCCDHQPRLVVLSTSDTDRQTILLCDNCPDRMAVSRAVSASIMALTRYEASANGNAPGHAVNAYQMSIDGDLEWHDQDSADAAESVAETMASVQSAIDTARNESQWREALRHLFAIAKPNEIGAILTLSLGEPLDEGERKALQRLTSRVSLDDLFSDSDCDEANSFAASTLFSDVVVEDSESEAEYRNAQHWRSMMRGIDGRRNKHVLKTKYVVR